MRTLRLLAVLLCLALVGAFAPTLAARAATTTAGTYYPVTSARLLDTRHGVGAPVGKLGAGKTLSLTVAGRGGVPTTGVSAVVINLTATEGAVAGFFAAYPTGQVRPASSSLNYQVGVSRANTVTVPLGTGGKINIYSSASVSVIADIVGFYASGSTTPAGTGNEFTTVAPDRLIDTRYDPDGILVGDDILTLYVDFGTNGAQNSSVAALAVNITAVGAQSSGYLTAFNGGSTVPTTSTLNFPNGAAIANTAVVKSTLCTTCGSPAPVQIAVHNASTKGVHVIVDLVGVYYHDGTIGLRFKPVTPVRIKDSRTTSPVSPLKPAQTQTVTAPASAAGSATQALVTNLTAVAPSSSTYLTAWANGTTKPAVSNLNTQAHLTAANGAVVELSAANKFNVFNSAGTANYVVDVVGQFNVIAGSTAAAQRVSTTSQLSRTSVHSDRESAGAAR